MENITEDIVCCTRATDFTSTGTEINKRWKVPFTKFESISSKQPSARHATSRCVSQTRNLLKNIVMNINSRLCFSQMCRDTQIPYYIFIPRSSVTLFLWPLPRQIDVISISSRCLFQSRTHYFREFTINKK